ncbi:MAG TPA: hypothetical protein VK966_08075 [Longimicrobiales bacterium]|nr:hypothetical protein [Longimicrobiales bacterium]
MNRTDRYRGVAWTLVSLTVLAALYGWLFRDLDPSALAWIVAAPAIGEGANVGKRATFKREAVDR